MRDLLQELLRAFWEGTWRYSLYVEAVPSCPDIPDEITLEVDGARARVAGPDWVEEGSLIAVHALLDRVWDRLGWPALRDFRGERNSHFVAHGWEDFVYAAAEKPLLALSTEWPVDHRVRLLAVLRSHRAESAEEALLTLSKHEPAAAQFIEELDSRVKDLFEGKRSRSYIKLLERAAELFQSRKTLSRYALLLDAAVYATGSVNAPCDSVIKRATPLFVSFDPHDELAIAGQTVRESAACYALEGDAAELCVPHLDVLIGERRNRVLNSYRRARAHLCLGNLEQARMDFSVLENAVARFAEHTGDAGWRDALSWARADWLVGGCFGLAIRRDGLAPCKRKRKKAKARPPKLKDRDRWEAARQELLEPTLSALAGLNVYRDRKWPSRFLPLHLRTLDVSGIEAKVRSGTPA